ncbi:MAG: glycosyltransferase family 4 protein [Nitrospirae bacterium]|nr:MAG: glycosyltransferase family 4 protein [Nitrospirota bacterium]
MRRDALHWMNEMEGERRYVLHLITRMDGGGSARNTFLTAIGHDRKQFRVGLIHGRPVPLTAEEAAVMKADLKLLSQAGVRVFEVPALVREVRPILDARATVALWRLLCRERPALVHTHTSKAGVVGRLAAWLARVPVVIHTPHGHIFYGYYGAAASALIRLVERLLAKITDRIVTLTDRGAEEHVRLHIAGMEKFVTIHSGIDLAHFRSVQVDPAVKRKELGLPPDGAIVGTVGRLVPIKGLEWLLKAAPQVLAQFPQACFVIIGDGPLLGELRQLTSKLGIGLRVVFLGAREDVPECLAALDLFVLPSLNEGMGRVLLEAMAVGCPVVATRVGGIPDIVADGTTGLLVPPRDERALAEAILTLLRDRSRRAAYGEAARRHIDGRFDVETMVRSVERLYDEVWREKHPAT